MKRVWIAALIFCAANVLSACSTPYGPNAIFGGYSEKEIEPSIWRVRFGGNGYTTYETVQTYWLYRCAEMTIEKGFDGFEIISNIRLVDAPPAPESLTSGSDKQLAAVAQYYIPMYIPQAPMPFVEADIRLLRQPLDPVPGKRFNAADLKNALEPYVKGKKCDADNVCPHVHRYLYPVPAADDKAS